MELPADRIKEQPVDPLSMSSLTKAKEPGGRSASGHDGGSGKKKPARKVTGRLWMAEDFPISLCELLPILEVIGYTNKHLKKVAG